MAEYGQSGNVRQREIWCCQPFEQTVSGEIKRRSANDDGGRRHIDMSVMPLRVMQHEFVSDCGDDDGRNDQDVQMCVAAARYPAGIGDDAACAGAVSPDA